jgi:hypothetical protein
MAVFLAKALGLHWSPYAITTTVGIATFRVVRSLHDGTPHPTSAGNDRLLQAVTN